MALVCSPNSGSSAKPSWPASELRDTTGNTTLMVLPTIPRVDVLALLTGDGWAVPELPVDPVGAAVVDDADGVEVPQAATHTRSAPITIVKPRRVRRERPPAPGRWPDRAPVGPNRLPELMSSLLVAPSIRTDG